MKRRIFVPSAPQQIAIPFIGEVPRCALWASMGIGKTSTVATVLAARYRYMGVTKPTLIIGPKRVARDVWPNEFLKWEHLAGIDTATMIGDITTRKRALAQDVPIHTINYENLPWLIDTLGERWPYGTIVADESTRLKNFRLKGGGLYASWLGRRAHKSTRFIELTGTPAPNGLKDLWGQAWFLDAGKRLGRTFGGLDSFESRWFGYRRVRDALNAHKTHMQTVIFPGADEQIHAALSDVCLTLDAKDYFDLHEPRINIVPVQLGKSARQRYRDMEKELFAVLESGAEIEAVSLAGKSIKCLQLASGAVYTDKEGSWEEVHDEKLDALESIVEEAAGMPLLVSIWWQHDRARILKRFKDAVDLATDEGMAAFKAGRARIGVAAPKNLGHGYDGLQEVTCEIAFFSDWWDMELHDQIIERIGPMRQLQSGFDRVVTIHHIIAEGTIDEDVMARHGTKRSVQDLLKDAMKRRA